MNKLLYLFCFLQPTFIVVNGQPINKLTDLNENVLIYSLPRSEIALQFKYVKTTYLKGRFAEFSLKYLGTEAEIRDNYIAYDLSDISVNIHNSSDPHETYMYSPEKTELKSEHIENLANKGAIYLFTNNPNVIYYNSMPTLGTKTSNGFVVYESPLKDKLDTIYKREYRDTAWVQVPYYQRNYFKKTNEDHAQEAANILLGLNYKLLKSTDRLDPEDEFSPQVSEALIEKTESLKNQYYRYFHGYKLTDTLIFNALMVPEKDIYEYQIANFTRENGITKQVKAENAVVLTFYPPSIPEQLKADKVKATGNQMITKYPSRTEFSISHDGSIISGGFINIYQFGYYITVPAKFIGGK